MKIDRIILLVTLAAVFLSCSDGNDGRIKGTGTIEAVQVRVSSKLAAHAEHVYLEEGDRVFRGDTLVILDRSAVDIQLRQAEAGVELAEAQLDLTLKGAREEDIRSAEETVRQAEANLTTAREDLRRIRNLYDANSISRKQLDDAEARYTIASAQYNSAGQNLEKLRELTRPEEIRVMRAKLNQAKANADLLRKAQRDCYITAPGDGIITSKTVERGELVGQGATVAVISKLDTVRLMIYLTAKEIGRVRIGDNVDVMIDAFDDREYTGIITYISPDAEFTPRNIQTKDERVKQVFGVRVEIPNPDGSLKPGLPADAFVRME